MKKLLFIVIGFMFAVSMAFASPSDQMDFTTMSKADTQMLFGEKQKVAQGKIILLNSEQLQSTQAKGWWSSVIREVQRNLGYINNLSSTAKESKKEVTL
jgi:thiamine biosynthesis protein ThiC